MPKQKWNPSMLSAALYLLSPNKEKPLDKMKLWNEAFTTDPRAVKKITGKSYQGDSPKPFWLIQRATEIFGPIGIGWGVTVKSERFERVSETDTLHVAVVSVWYVLDGVKSETFDQMGGTKAAYMTAGNDRNPPKMMVDEDAGKKSVTDGMVKCLSMLGFAGDIFSGLWNDSKYVQWAGEETRRREQGEQQPAPEPEPKKRGQSTLQAAAQDNPVDPDEKPYLDELAMDMAEASKKAGDGEPGAVAAYELMHEKGLENNQMLYLSTRISPALRNAVARVSRARNPVTA